MRFEAAAAVVRLHLGQLGMRSQAKCIAPPRSNALTLASRLGRQANCLLAVLNVDVGEDDIRSLAGLRQRGGPADPGAPAGHQGHSAVGPLLPLISRVGSA